jgi:hypothetical protein
LSRDSDTEAKVFAKSLSHLLHELDLVGSIVIAPATALMSRPLPINVDTLEVPLRAKLLEGVNEGFAVLRLAGHIGERVLRCAWIIELKSANTNPLRDSVR